jgi:hypothetical protein
LFEVLPEKARPFMVESGGMTVKALGTSFDVRNYAGRMNMETVLLSGKVEVAFAGNDEVITLEPGQSVLYDHRLATFKVREVIAADHIIWTLNKLSLKDEKLSTILYKMEKWYGIEFAASGNIPNDMRLSLTIRKESKEEIFSILEIIAPISFRDDGHTVQVKPSKIAHSSINSNDNQAKPRREQQK